MARLMQLLGLSPSEEEQKLLGRLNRLKTNIRVSGRGALKISVKDARSTVGARQFVDKINGTTTKN